MRVSPVELDSCGSCNIQPLFDRLRPEESSLYEQVNGKATLSDAIKGDTNQIRYPEVYYADGGIIPNIFFPAGSLLSRYA